MKKFFTLLCTLLAAQILYGQTITNAGFEEWTDNTHAVGWNSSFEASFTYSYMGIPLPITIDFNAVQKFTDAVHGGNFAVEVIPQQASVLTSSFNLPGIVQLGQFNTDSLGTMDFSTIDIDNFDFTQFIYGGIACGQLPTKATAWVMYAPVDGDTLLAGVIATRWNNGQREIVAQGEYTNNNPIDQYTQIEIPFTVKPGMEGVNPDTVNIIFCTSRRSTNENTRLYIDDVELVMGGTGIFEVGNLPIFNVQPNPATDFIVVTPISDEPYAVRMYDLNGKLVWAENGLAGSTRFPVSEMAKGTYLLQVKQGANVRTQKVILN